MVLYIFSQALDIKRPCIAPSVQEVVATIHQEYLVQASQSTGKRARDRTGEDEDSPEIDPASIASGVFVLKTAIELEQKQ